VFRTIQTIEKLYASLFFKNTAQNRILADGVLARFEENYAAQVNGDDAEDIANFDENIAFARDGKMLSIESLALSDINDTLFLKMHNLKQQAYELQFDAVNFNSLQTKQAYLKDNYIGSETPIALTGITILNFTVTNDPASAAFNRFTIVFKTSSALPVNILSVKGYEKNSGINIEWETAKESNMDRYEVERSTDGQTFISKSVIAAKNSSIINNYSWFDNKPEIGNNLYRIRAISKDGTVRYSSVATIFIARKSEGMSVFPNPVSGKVLGIQLKNIAKGSYIVNLINNIGQTVSTRKIEHPGGSAIYSITASNTFIPGIYIIRLTGGNTTLSQQILKQ
ncbi:MAG: T9SS type A sorting domain-containing protein, partial [Segetibacter sp.]